MTTQPFAPPPVPSAARAGSALGVWSLVLGIAAIIASIFCMGSGLLVAIPAVICGHAARSRLQRAGSRDAGGVPLAGLITGYIGLGLGLVIGPMMLAIAVPSFVKARGKAQEMACNNNLRQISAAKDQYGLDHNSAVPTSMSDLSPLYIMKSPVCPKQGTYAIGGKDQDPVCSVHGDALNKPARRTGPREQGVEK
jgi:competence protein ComGC